MNTKVVFETATFADAIKKADRVAPKKGHAFDKAAGIVIEVNPNGPELVIVRATNLDVFSMEWVNILEWEGDEKVWRMPALFAQVIASLPIGSGKTLTLEDDGRQVHLKSGRTKARFFPLDASYFPEWEAFDPDSMFPVQDLGGRLQQVEWAASKAEVPINGVYIDGQYAVATDRYRLAAVPLGIPDLEEPITVPAGLLGQALKQSGEVQIGVENGMLQIMPDEHTQIKCVIYSEAYPNVNGIMSRELPDRITVNKTPLLEIMQRATNFATGDRIPSLKVFFGKEKVAVMMNNEEIGLLGDSIEIPGQAQHDLVEIKFTPKNIMDAISQAPNEQIDIDYDQNKTLNLVAIDGGSGYRAWVVPRADLNPQDGA